MNFEQLFTGFQSIRVAILGDVMLDTYWWGSVDRISPEAPVPVVALKNKELRVGGAANVALNTASLGAKTTMISIVGADTDGEQLLQLLKDKHIDTSYIRSVSNRVTTNKTRIMSRNQQMMRLDAEITIDIDEATENMLIEQVKHCLEEQQPQVLIFEDYNKGVITERIIQTVTALCKERNVIIAVDPKKKNFLSYKDVTIFKPNLKEVKEGLNLSVDHIDLSSLQQIHQRLQEHLHHQISLITLSEKGVFYQDETSHKIIPTHIRNIADVSGAGDTVIAVTSLCYAATRDMHLAAEMANIAGGLVCEQVGTAAIDRDKLLQECEILLGE
ncbi:MAG: bifunctional ADP-heptose synthase [Sediminibacterium sp.]|jgi:D-glycero-beta-D-manno-heptose-7-phosphate kinase|uniref:bifunctional heptose 7-phosphate kinase/heptose 1-phosphate adenyltransferase n=1 Tax=Sediminibacterium sp. TaxID=1917865 RepID=UPI002ABA87A6|nr:bifunctional ADP-heptose synthase [Sediminibacterium sp.]MDZ4072438.1 bifunctional ADP-heptose synthase [Sediminibacterium sp.]